MNKDKESEYAERDKYCANHEFPEKIAALLDTLRYEKKECRYYGAARKHLIEFGVDGNMLICNNITTHSTIFAVDVNIKPDYLLVLMQAFGLVNYRFIYERVDAIYDDFLDNQEQ